MVFYFCLCGGGGGVGGVSHINQADGTLLGRALGSCNHGRKQQDTRVLVILVKVFVDMAALVAVVDLAVFLYLWSRF